MIFKKRDKKETRVRTLFKDNNNQKKKKKTTLENPLKATKRKNKVKADARNNH